MSRFAHGADVLSALEGNLWSQWAQFGRGPGCALHREAGALWYDTPIRVPPYNMVLRFQGGADPDREIDRIFEHFAQRQVPFLWLMHPSAQPGDLAARLNARGFEDVEPITGMAADLADLPALPALGAGLAVHPVTPAHDMAPFLEMVATRWHVPEEARPHLHGIARTFRVGEPGSPNRALIAVKDGQALSKVVTHEVEGAVGIYGVATKPEAQGLGLAYHLVVRALHEARARGIARAVLHSTPMAASLYRRIGFHEVAMLNLFARPHSFQA